MANKHMKRCYTSYVIREMKIKTTLRYCNVAIWMVKIQNTDNVLCWWGWRLRGALLYHWFSSVQSLHQVWLFATPWTASRQASLSITNSRSPPKPTSIESVMPFSLFILSSPSPPAFNLYQHQGLFKWVSSSHQVAKVLEFQLQHQSFQWTPRTDLL